MMREQFNYFDVMSKLARINALLVREGIVLKVSISVLMT